MFNHLSSGGDLSQLISKFSKEEHFQRLSNRRTTVRSYFPELGVLPSSAFKALNLFGDELYGSLAYLHVSSKMKPWIECVTQHLDYVRSLVEVNDYDSKALTLQIRALAEAQASNITSLANTVMDAVKEHLEKEIPLLLDQQVKLYFSKNKIQFEEPRVQTQQRPQRIRMGRLWKSFNRKLNQKMLDLKAEVFSEQLNNSSSTASNDLPFNERFINNEIIINSEIEKLGKNNNLKINNNNKEINKEINKDTEEKNIINKPINLKEKLIIINNKIRKAKMDNKQTQKLNTFLELKRSETRTKNPIKEIWNSFNLDPGTLYPAVTYPCEYCSRKGHSTIWHNAFYERDNELSKASKPNQNVKENVEILIYSNIDEEEKDYENYNVKSRDIPPEDEEGYDYRYEEEEYYEEEEEENEYDYEEELKQVQKLDYDETINELDKYREEEKRRTKK